MNLHSCGLFLCMLHYFQFVFHIWYTLILGKSPVFIFPCLIQLARGKVKCSASLPRIAIVSQFDFSSLCWFMFDLGKFFNFPFDSLGHFKDAWNFLSTLVIIFEVFWEHVAYILSHACIYQMHRSITFYINCLWQTKES